MAINFAGSGGPSRRRENLDQAGAPEKVLKSLIRAVVVKDWIHAQVSHPDRVIVVGGLQPLKGVFFIVQRSVNLSQAIRRDVSLSRHRFQFVRDSERFRFLAPAARPTASCAV